MYIVLICLFVKFENFISCFLKYKAAGIALKRLSRQQISQQIFLNLF